MSYYITCQLGGVSRRSTIYVLKVCMICTHRFVQLGYGKVNGVVQLYQCGEAVVMCYCDIVICSFAASTKDNFKL